MSKISSASLLAAADEAPDFTPIPASTYDAEVVGAEAKRSSKDDPQIKIDFRIVGGEYNNRRLSNWTTFVAGSPGVIQMSFRQLGALGFTRAYFEAHPQTEDMDAVLATIAQTLPGRTCQLRVAQEPRRNGEPGEMSNSIKNVLPPPLAQGPVPAPTATALTAAAGTAAGIPGGMDVFAPPTSAIPGTPAMPVPPRPGEAATEFPPPPF